MNELHELWRDEYRKSLNGYINTIDKCERVGLKLQFYRSRKWCETAISILDGPSAEDFLLMKPRDKDKAVLRLYVD